MRTSIVLLSILIPVLTLVPGRALALSKKAPSAPPVTLVAANSESETVWIGKSDEAKSCGTEKGISLDVMATQLQAADVKVLAKKKVSDGKMRIQSCGADKGDLNGFLIARKDVEKAKNIGFKPVPGNH